MPTLADIRAFAERRVATRRELSGSHDFPHDLWAGMARAGLLGMSLPAEHGGGGADSPALLAAGEAFVRDGGCLGLATAWFGHAAVARWLILPHATPAQRERYLPRLAAGALTASVAISEPGAGAHPKHLAAEAVAEQGGFRITGEKQYVTNGNIAGLFVVVAITGREGGRKRFSAFLVEREAAGLEIEPMPPLDFLLPSAHVRLHLRDCRVEGDALLGAEGEAFRDLAGPFREIEDTLGAGPMVGALGRLLDGLRGGQDAPEELSDAAGVLSARLTALRALAAHGAALLDADARHPDLVPLTLAFRDHVRDYLAVWGAASESATAASAPPATQALAAELEKLLAIPRAVERIKRRKLGEEALRT